MAPTRSFILPLALALCAVAAFGMNNSGAVVAGLAAGPDDDCCQGDPCTGATDECSCPCCPSPAVEVSSAPMAMQFRSTPVVLAAALAPASVAHPSLDHPPE